MASFRLTPDAIDDLEAIWSFIFKDDPGAADAVEEGIRLACAMLAKRPLIGRVRRDLTTLPVHFWTIPRHSNYIIVYKPDSEPIEIVRVLHGMRNIKRILGESL